ncbi:MAG: hypothetical protein WAT65_05700, partial [Candidatus Nanopelagicales bacterium]
MPTGELVGTCHQTFARETPATTRRHRKTVSQSSSLATVVQSCSVARWTSRNEPPLRGSLLGSR